MFKNIYSQNHLSLNSVLLVNLSDRSYTRWTKEENQMIAVYFERWLAGDELPGK